MPGTIAPAQSPGASSGAGSDAQTVAAAARRHTRFHELLSELNPLQYLPLIGTIYRAVTGDEIPDSARTVGSLVVGGLMGGLVGLAVNVAALAVERATGIDPKKIGREVLADVGVGKGTDVAAATASPEAPAAIPAPTAMVTQGAFSQAQLTAYGVTTTAGGTLKRGAVEGADVLNDMEIARLG
jgi:hypothetical protein